MSLSAWTYVPTGFDTDPILYGDMVYSELKGSGNVNTSPGNPGVDRIFLVAHSRLPFFLDDLIGWSEVRTSGNPPLIRSLPDPHPIYTNMYCAEASALGEGYFGQYAQKYAKYDVAIVQAKYKSLDYPVLSDTAMGAKTNELDRFVTRTYGFGGDILSVTGSGMQFLNNAVSGKHKLVPVPPGKVTMTLDMTYTWHWVPVQDPILASSYVPPNIDSITTCFGKVNSTIFDPTHMACPPGTVLFLGVDPRLTNYRIGTIEDANDGYTNIYWEISMKFLYRNNGLWSTLAPGTPTPDTATCGHNHLYDPTYALYDLVSTDGTISGKNLYAYADLNTLFTID